MKRSIKFLTTENSPKPVYTPEKLFDFDATMLQELPYFLKFMQPYVDFGEQHLVRFMEWSNLPIVGVLIGGAFTFRMFFMPIVFL